MGSQLKLSIVFHPQTDEHLEHTIQTLEDMLRLCAMDFGKGWEEQLTLVEFAYNNNYHASIGTIPFEALYRQPCRSPLCWAEVKEKHITGPELVEESNRNINVIRKRLLTVQGRQKSYADRRCRELNHEEENHVFLKIAPSKGQTRFGLKGKLSPRFIEPFHKLTQTSIDDHQGSLVKRGKEDSGVVKITLLTHAKSFHLFHVEREGCNLQFWTNRRWHRWNHSV